MRVRYVISNAFVKSKSGCAISRKAQYKDVHGSAIDNLRGARDKSLECIQNYTQHKNNHTLILFCTERW